MKSRIAWYAVATVELGMCESVEQHKLIQAGLSWGRLR